MLGVYAEHSSLAGKAYEILRNRLISLELSPGIIVSESDLADTMKMSRTPVREAIRRLHYEGLMEVLPQHGVRISLISMHKVEEAQSVRRLLEGNILTEVAESWQGLSERKRWVERSIHTLLELQETCAGNGDILEFIKLDEMFHSTLLELFGNTTLLAVIAQMRAQLNRARHVILCEMGNMDHFVLEHVSLFESIRSGDSAHVRWQIDEHLGNLQKDLQVVRSRMPQNFAD